MDYWPLLVIALMYAFIGGCFAWWSYQIDKVKQHVNVETAAERTRVHRERCAKDKT